MDLICRLCGLCFALGNVWPRRGEGRNKWPWESCWVTNLIDFSSCDFPPLIWHNGLLVSFWLAPANGSHWRKTQGGAGGVQVPQGAGLLSSAYCPLQAALSCSYGILYPQQNPQSLGPLIQFLPLEFLFPKASWGTHSLGCGEGDWLQSSTRETGSDTYIGVAVVGLGTSVKAP